MIIIISIFCPFVHDQARAHIHYIWIVCEWRSHMIVLLNTFTISCACFAYVRYRSHAHIRMAYTCRGRWLTHDTRVHKVYILHQWSWCAVLLLFISCVSFLRFDNRKLWKRIECSATTPSSEISTKTTIHTHSLTLAFHINNNNIITTITTPCQLTI